MEVRSSRYRSVGLMQITYQGGCQQFGWEHFDCQLTLAAQMAAELIRLTNGVRRRTRTRPGQDTLKSLSEDSETGGAGGGLQRQCFLRLGRLQHHNISSNCSLKNSSGVLLPNENKSAKSVRHIAVSFLPDVNWKPGEGKTAASLVKHQPGFSWKGRNRLMFFAAFQRIDLH